MTTIQWLGTPRRAVGVGQVERITVPLECSTPEFWLCHDDAFALAQFDCARGLVPEAGTMSYDDCVQTRTNRQLRETCLRLYCPPEVTQGLSFPWNVESPATRTLQQNTNAIIRDTGSGFCEIEEDGILGPMTCKAVSEVDPLGLPAACNQRRAEWTGTVLPRCAPEECAPGLVRVGGRCVAPQPPRPPPAPSPAPTPTTTAGGIGTGGAVALLTLAALAGYFILTQV
jgi:hypothetical protein